MDNLDLVVLAAESSLELAKYKYRNCLYTSRPICPCYIKHGISSACPHHNFSIIHPEFLDEWDTSNIIAPNEVSPGSCNKIWWKCFQGHRWFAPVYVKRRGIPCPYCTNTIRRHDRLPLTVRILRLWDYNRNPNPPIDYCIYSRDVVWWLCKRGHRWQDSIEKHAKKPYCKECLKWSITF
jgi:hypothetical protein